MIDTSMPVTMKLNVNKKNPKKQQMIEDRYTEIERANRILLEKMSNILAKNGAYTTKNNFHQTNNSSLSKPWKTANNYKNRYFSSHEYSKRNYLTPLRAA